MPALATVGTSASRTVTGGDRGARAAVAGALAEPLAGTALAPLALAPVLAAPLAAAAGAAVAGRAAPPVGVAGADAQPATITRPSKASPNRHGARMATPPPNALLA